MFLEFCSGKYSFVHINTLGNHEKIKAYSFILNNCSAHKSVPPILWAETAHKTDHLAN